MAVSRPNRHSSRWSHLPLLAMVLVLLLAFGLRVYHLDFQSLWTDEGRSLLRASVPLSQVASVTPVEHMPTYFAASHLWLEVAGSTDFALRFTSTIASVLAIALAYRLALELGSPGAGLIAALLLATGSFQVWYAQEARMYTWMLATSLLSTWMLWRLVTRWPAPGPVSRADSPALTRDPFFPRSRGFYLTFAVYVLSTAATIALHHYGFVLPLTQAVFMLLWLALTRDLRAFSRWLLAGICVAVLYVPAVPRLLGMLGYSGWEQQQASAAQLPWYFLTAYTAGDPMPDPWHTWLPWLYLVLMLLGVMTWWRKDRLATLLLVCGVVVPILAAWALALVQPQFHERYTMLVTAPLLILVGHGLSAFNPAHRRGSARFGAGSAGPEKSRGVAGGLPRTASRILAAVLAVAVLGLVVAANGLAMNRLYFDTSLQKADYKTAAALVQQGELAGDVIIADDSMLPDTFSHYYRGALQVYDLTLAKYDSGAGVDAAVAAAVSGARRVWTIDHSGGNSPITARLLASGWPATSFDHNGLHLALIGLPSAIAVPLNVGRAFGEDLVLEGASLSGQAPGADPVAFRAGDIAQITTRWRVKGSPGSLKFSLRLLGPEGTAWANADYVPQGGPAPNGRWQPGATFEDRRALLLPSDLAPGPYQIWLTIYDADSGAAVPAGDQPGVTMAKIKVLSPARPPDPQALAIPNRVGSRLGPDLEVLGFGVEPAPAPVSTGGTLSVWWRSTARTAEHTQVQVELAGLAASPVLRATFPLSPGETETLLPGEIVRGRYPLTFAPDTPSGNYRLNLSLLGPDGKPAGPGLAAGTVAVMARQRTYRLPHVEHPLDVSLGPAVSLRGYGLESLAGAQPSKLTLYWQAKQRVTGRYKVFVHVLDPAGKIVAQGDSYPAEGSAPTEGWLAGEVIPDVHRLSVPPGGPYRVVAGLYDPASGERLAAVDQQGTVIRDAAIPVGELPASG